MEQAKKALLEQPKKEVRSLSQQIKIAILDPQTQTTQTRYKCMRLEVKTLQSLTVFPFASSQ